MRRIGFAFMLCLLTIGCSNANWSALSAWGQDHCVRMYGCDGKEIARWTSTGKIENESNSNGFYFQDKATKQIVMVDGNFTATVGECGEVPPQDR